MLDPLLALGLVANVVQFIDFTVKLIGKASDIHQSASGSLVEHDDLSKVTEDVTILSTKLQHSLIVTGTNGSLTNDDQALYDLSKGCFEVSQELTRALRTLQLNGKSSRFRSVQQALKTVWSKDDIKLLERRVGLYKNELNFRIIVRLRIDHERLSNNISDLSEQSIDQCERLLDAQAINKMAVELAFDRNMTEHEKTRQEMNRLKAEAERQVEVLMEEIRQLKLELEASVKTIVASMGTATKKESQKLKDISNAKFNLWVAKELILEKLKAFIALFRFNFGSEMSSTSTDIQSWKLMPYPKPVRARYESVRPRDDSPGASDASIPHTHVEPIHAVHSPTFKMCHEQDFDMTVALPDQLGRGQTRLTKAVDPSCRSNSLYSIPKAMVARRDLIKIVRCLLEHEANTVQAKNRAGSV
ncbi:hypothetical protein BKA63DRAFT_114623 [Paraphoma chrysanthemicola]|nr:hypothetical protein BKA63DRAFT_114623 [Paraphoma chrysanthemicola]